MAQRWFGLQTDEHHKVILMDGIKYIEESVEKGRRFDIIFLDACFLKEGTDVMCPSAVFLENDVIKNIAQLLGEKGVLAVNVLLYSSGDKALEKITSKFEQHFKYGKLSQAQYSSNYFGNKRHDRVHLRTPQNLARLSVRACAYAILRRKPNVFGRKCDSDLESHVYIAILAWSEDFEYSIEEEEEKELQYTDEYSEEDFIKLIVSIYGKSRFLEEFCLSHDTCMDVRDELVKRKNRFLTESQSVMAAKVIAAILLSSALIFVAIQVASAKFNRRHQRWRLWR
ncbi:hypothetical protein NECAME_16311 [Necator americanus]|uniref:PABS domain-containing protein n=1 Tax=Necator americanus TaxID=51031 RepID=W2TZJ2_NECAM|nr:hypothetical protein NECAME_16311 [Necator americanus]ETN86486.1 hypothetical protein NECAME_16311 [Necator americanus]